jgi:hypothetical protein
MKIHLLEKRNFFPTTGLQYFYKVTNGMQDAKGGNM